MRFATIDIGTNTVLLLVADVDNSGAITPVAYEQRIPRLGKDVDAKKHIGKQAFERVANVLSEYKIIYERLKPEKIVAVGTSAVRDAVNKDEFVSYIKTQTGVEVEVITGEEEAKLVFFGALSGIQLDNKRQIAVIDIGGGSTEIITGTKEEIQIKVSLDIGSVRITERFLKLNPPSTDELHEARAFIENTFQSAHFDLKDAVVVGVAGTVTTLAALDQGLKEFDREKISGYRLTQTAVSNLLIKLQRMTTDMILSLSTLTHGRADILTAGTLILHTFMKKTSTEEISVSERGVRYGLALREWRKHGFEQ
jgi:exopolyphosphatase/guanosine-5'-triphosphate,3'-diphosphate pyrophosphatase